MTEAPPPSPLPASPGEGEPEGVFIPFRLKVLGAFSTLLSAVLFATLLFVVRVLTAGAERDVRRQLDVTREVFAHTLALRERQLAVASRLLAGDFAFKQALATRDAATIESNAHSLRERVGADTVWIADDEGRLVADTGRDLKRGALLAKMPAVRKALEQGQGADVASVAGKVYQLAAVPVTAPDLIGLLVAGFRVDDATAAQLKRQTLTDVSFATDAGVFASTLDPARRAALEARRAGLPLGRPELVGPPGRQDLALAAPVAKGVVALIERSWDESLEPLAALKRLLLLLGLGALALTVAVGYAIANSVTASMEELAEATGRIAAGDFGVRVTPRGRDEIGRLAYAFNAMTAGLREREKIRSVLRKAVSKEIADELLKRGQINLGGEERLVTVLFSDVRGFTTISEGLAPHELVSELNEYFGRMAKAIEEQRGVIDKYVGDAIMALFGAPLDSPEDAAHALRAALGMRRALEVLNRERAARSLPPWDTGIGVNTGPAVAGTLGSENRWSYTVIGDSVNLSSRLEGLTKHYGCAVLVSAAARERAGAGFAHRSVDLVRVKGRHHAEEVFALLGLAAEAPAWLAGWEDGIRAYRKGALGEARRAFAATAKAVPGDALAAEYLARLDGLGESAPANWDPAYTALEK